MSGERQACPHGLGQMLQYDGAEIRRLAAVLGLGVRRVFRVRRCFAERAVPHGDKDGGTVFDSSYPDFDETFRWAAGLGLRYFTGVGPLRLDFAFPLDKRDRDDAGEQRRLGVFFK